MTLSLLTSVSSAPALSDTCVLGGVLIGPELLQKQPVWPEQRLLAPVFEPGSVVEERWMLTPEAAVRSGESEGIRWRRTDHLMFGTIALDESAFASSTLGTPLQLATHAAYARIFRLLDEQGLAHLWRVWNYMADIHGDLDTLERYRQFNMGRGDAFEAGARSVVGRVPAACALGVSSGPLTVAFLAGTTPIIPVENPRQVSAFLYPTDYGPRSPTFARAALAYPPGQEMLFVSGTASIVGHKTVHEGHVVAQTEESLSNVEAVLSVASGKARSGSFHLSELDYRVYVRHSADCDIVRATIARRAGNVRVVCMQADICRAELLVEIEGHVIR